MKTCDPTDVRLRILLEATRLFGQKGYSATSVREVVAAAGVTKPMLYYYFANKEALFTEAVAAQLDGLHHLVEHVVVGEGPVVPRLKEFLELYVLGGLEYPESVRLMMTAVAPTDASQPKVVTISRFTEELARLESCFQQGIATGELREDLDCPMAVRLLIGAANETLMGGLAGLPVPEDFAQRILATLVEGLSA